MTDRYQVYIKVLKMLKQMTQTYHQGHLATLAMMITGIVLSRHAQLSTMSLDIPAESKDKSIEMRLRRWVKDSRVETDAIYMPFARQLLEALASLPLILVLDGSQAGRGCMVLMVGVIFKKRALPIAWLVYRGKKGHTTAQRHIQALEKVIPLLPAGCEVVLLGDAEYDTTEMIVWVQENTAWHYALRTAPQIHVCKDQVSQPVGSLPLSKGRVAQYAQVGFTQDASIILNLVGWWGSQHEGPIYLVTNLSNAYQACKYYRRRFQIETFFSDQKSRGFHIHKSHLSDPVRLGRMLIAACLAYIWMICQGLWVIAEEKTGLIDRTDRMDKSLFRLGLDWVKFAIKRNLTLEPIFQLQPVLSNANVR
jgi:hypothetical protein